MSVRHVFSGRGPGSLHFWGGDMGFVRGDAQKCGGVHMGLLGQIMGKRVVRQEDGTWRNVAS